MQQAHKEARLLVPGGPGPAATSTIERPRFMIEVMPDLSRRVTLEIGNAAVCHRAPAARIVGLRSRITRDAPPALLAEILDAL